MKNITKYLRTLLVFCILVSAKINMAQGTCTAVIITTVGLNGVVTFSAAAYNNNGNGITGNISWAFGDGATASGYNMSNTTHNYANGLYTASVTVSNTLGCNSTATRTLSITNSGCNLDADFIQSSGSSGLITFTNTTTTGTVSGVTYTWYFGDGGTSISPNTTSHIYTANGYYVASLVANNNGSVTCIDTQTMMVSVQSVCDLTPALTFTMGSNGSVTIKNVSTSASGNPAFYSYYLNFGDGSGGTALGYQNMITHIYMAGTFNAVLSATNASTPSCTLATSSPVTVGTPGCGLLAGFTTSPGSSGLINFNNTSTGATGAVTYNWNFGDGSPNSSSISPAHTYAANGPFVVTLAANNNSSVTCTDTKTLTIYVQSVCDLTPSFIYTIGANGQAEFSNNSISGAPAGYSYRLNFGDGASSAISWGGGGGGNPLYHTYTNGLYNVVLTATNIATPTCTYLTVQTITITSGLCVANANFSMTPTGTPQFWNAFPIAPANIIAATWDWGDNSASNILYTTHTYSTAATYSICLSVTVTCGATNTACMSYAIYKPSGTNQNMDVIQVTVIDPSNLTAIGTIKNSTAENIEFTISPNPNNGTFQLNMNGPADKKIKTTVYNIVGKEIYASENESQNGSFVKDVNLEEMPDGVYFIKINSENKTLTKKIVINKQ